MTGDWRMRSRPNCSHSHPMRRSIQSFSSALTGHLGRNHMGALLSGRWSGGATMAGLRMTFLEGDSTPEQLLPAVVGNHRQWLLYSARLKGGEVRRENGATWVSTPGSEGYWSMVFPRMNSATADRQL